MQYGVPNKYEIFQDFYFRQNGVQISYKEALYLFSYMDDDTVAEFEQYYQDETGYEIIVPSGYNLDPDLGTIKENGTKTVKKKERQKDGSIKWVDKTVKDWTMSKTFTLEDGSTVTVDNYVPATTQNAINVKYSLEAYAKKNGIDLDSEWAIYSAEEIIAMADNGVDIPQDVIDIANTILQSTATSEEIVEGEEDQDVTANEMSFLELIPKAETDIEKCEENNEKIQNEIENLLPEKQKQEKNMAEMVKNQTEKLSEYEDNVREWTKLNNKIKNGEVLTDTESQRYSDLTEAMDDQMKDGDETGFKKSAIASSLNELNILAILGEKLADETIEIGDTLADYTSKANYKTTRKQVTGEIGFLRAIIAMAQGKNLAKEANVTGNDTKELAEATQESVNNIADLTDIELGEVSEEGEPIEVDNSEATSDTDEKEEDNEDKKEEKQLVLTDDGVLQLIKDVKAATSDASEQKKTAISQIRIAKADMKFTADANKRVDKIIDEFEVEEAERQRQIDEKERENEEAEREIEKLNDNGKDKAAQYGVKVKDDEQDEETKEKIAEYQKTINQNNDDIEDLQTESTAAVEDVKKNVSTEKTYLNLAVPDENDAFEINAKYQEKDLEEHNELFDLTYDSGLALASIGTGIVFVGRSEINLGQALMSNIFTMQEGMYWLALGIATVVKGSISIGIGLEAVETSEKGQDVEDTTEEKTDVATENINKALTNMNALDEKIVSVTGEDSADQSDDEEGLNTNNGTVDGEDTTEDNTTTTGTAEAETTTTNSTQKNSKSIIEDKTTEEGITIANTPENPDETLSETPTVETQDETVAEASSQATATERANSNENTEGSTEEGVTGISTTESSSGSSSSDDEEEDPASAKENAKKQESQLNKQADKQESIVKDGTNTANTTSKDAKKLEKDQKKDAKQLEKEAKKIEKEIKKEEQQVIKLTKESQAAIQKQQEIMAEYETLNSESEKMMAEEEAKQMSQPSQIAQQNNNDDDEGGGLLAANSLKVTSTSDGSDNQSKLAQNSARITELSISFKSQDSIVVRNKDKITRSQNSIEKKSETYQKKLKLKTKKLKDTEKKEKAKQKKLNKILGAIGIAENVFSITTTTGLVLLQTGTTMVTNGSTMITAGEALLPWPTTAAGIALISAGTALEVSGTAIVAVGGDLKVVGLVGTAACGVAKGAINIANGNLTAGLVAISSTAVTVATSTVGAGAAAGSALNYVSEGLSVVSSSAELVNNVRAVQEKEANGVMSKISTVAGVGSSLTGAASSVGNMSGQNTLGKMSTIASAAGAVVSSTGQLMGEFGGDENTANILNAVGSGLQTVGSLGQLANGKSDKDNSKSTNKDEDDNKAIDNNKNLTPEEKAQAKENLAKIKNDPDLSIEIIEAKNNNFDQKLNSVNLRALRDQIIDLKLSSMNLNAKQIETIKNGLKSSGLYGSSQAATNSNTTQIANESEGQGALSKSEKVVDTSEVKDTKIETPAETDTQIADAEALRSDDPTADYKKDVSTETLNSVEEQKNPETQTQEAKAQEELKQKNIKKLGASEEFAELDDAQLKQQLETELAKPEEAQDKSLIEKYQKEQKTRTEYQKNKKSEKLNQVLDFTGQAASSVAQTMSAFAAQQDQEGTTKKKNATPGILTERTKKIIEDNDDYRKKRIKALQKYYA
jgi:hypothetical protein